jgi:hypothetical protein
MIQWWLVIEFNQSSIGALNINEGTVSARFEPCRNVDCTTFSTSRSKLTFKPLPIGRNGVDCDVIEKSRLPRMEFTGRQLLVDLNAAHEAKLLRNEGRSICNFTNWFSGLRFGHEFTQAFILQDSNP